MFGQKVRGRWLLQSEIVAIDMGIVRFAELLRQEIATRFNNLDVYIYGDPAGDFRAQTDETTPFGILRGAGLKATPAPSNSIDLRLESVSSQLTKMVDGKSGLLIDRRCPQIIKRISKVVTAIEECKYLEKDMKINLRKICILTSMMLCNT